MNSTPGIEVKRGYRLIILFDKFTMPSVIYFKLKTI